MPLVTDARRPHAPIKGRYAAWEMLGYHGILWSSNGTAAAARRGKRASARCRL